MANIITRRGALGLGAAGALAAAAAAAATRRRSASRPRAPNRRACRSRTARRCACIRPTRFVEPDEVIFRENTAKFTQATGVQVRVDFVGWEDIRAQTAVTANTGAGPDVVIGWADDPHIYADKLIELSDVAEYLGKKYGGWMFLAEKYGKRARTNNWIGIPLGGSTGPDRVPHLGGEGGGLRQGAGGPSPASSASARR